MSEFKKSFRSSEASNREQRSESSRRELTEPILREIVLSDADDRNKIAHLLLALDSGFPLSKVNSLLREMLLKEKADTSKLAQTVDELAHSEGLSLEKSEYGLVSKRFRETGKESLAPSPAAVTALKNVIDNLEPTSAVAAIVKNAASEEENPLRSKQTTLEKRLQEILESGHTREEGARALQELMESMNKDPFEDDVQK